MEPITWDDTYAIVKMLQSLYPNVSIENVTLKDIYDWTIQLPGFDDDPQMSNDTVLLCIYTEWFEEDNPI